MGIASTRGHSFGSHRRDRRRSLAPRQRGRRQARATVPAAQSRTNSRQGISHAFRTAAEATIPSVVTITSETRQVRGDLRREKGNQRGENPFKGTPFEDFFNDRNGGIPFNMPEQRRTGVGAGVIIDRSGLVLTNNHVVEGATEVTVRLSDGREFKGTDIKTDKQTDLAIVRIEGAKDLHAATLGDSDARYRRLGHRRRQSL